MIVNGTKEGFNMIRKIKLTSKENNLIHIGSILRYDNHKREPLAHVAYIYILFVIIFLC